MTSHRADTAVRWARTTAGPVTLGEVQARLIGSDPRLARAVLESQRKRRSAGGPDRVGPGGWGHSTGGHSAGGHSWERWGVRRRALWIVLLLLPVVAVFYLPSRHARSPESAQLFFDVTFGTYLVAAAVQAILVVVWVARPLMWESTRFLSAWVTLAMVFVLPLLLLTVGTLRGSEGWLHHTIPVPVATVLAAANLWAAFSDRTRRQREARELGWLQSVLHHPEAASTVGPRGPARELRRTIRRLPATSQQALTRRCRRVLTILDERRLITDADAKRAGATPLGRWHDLD